MSLPNLVDFQNSVTLALIIANKKVVTDLTHFKGVATLLVKC